MPIMVIKNKHDKIKNIIIQKRDANENKIFIIMAIIIILH